MIWRVIYMNGQLDIITIPEYVKTEFLHADIRYFLAIAHIPLDGDGKLFSGEMFDEKNLVYVYTSEKASKRFDEYFKPFNLKEIKIDSSVLTGMLELLEHTAPWGWFEKQLKVMGPVSCFTAYSPLQKMDILLFGDIHDNLEVPDIFSHAEVLEQFYHFFGAAKTFYYDVPNFAHFKFIVQKMKLRMFGCGEEVARMFVWEFLVCMLHLFNATGTCLDIIVEDPLHMPYEASVPENYLDAVRYLFSICPMISEPDSVFAKFVPECQDLFPSLRYHRIDLRYNVYEDAKGTFEHDGFGGLMLFFTAGTMRIDEPSGFEQFFVYHGVDDWDDEQLLREEIDRMYEQFLNSLLVENLNLFLDAFRKSTTKHWNNEKRSKWFFVRTCITDIYGLARLYRKTKAPREKHSSQQATKICQESSYIPRKVICYLGDYHAKVWKDVIISLDENIFVSHDNSTNREERTIQFDAFTRKPLMPLEWNEPHEMFTNIMESKSDTYSKKNVFAQCLNNGSKRNFFVSYLTKEQLPIGLFYHPDYPKEYEMVQKLKDMRRKWKSRCMSDSDAFHNDFNEMSYDEIFYTYLKPDETGQKVCYSAEFMYALWKSSYAEHRAFRDPRTRKAISKTEKRMIEDKIGAMFFDLPQRALSHQVFSISIKALKTKNFYKVYVDVQDGSSYFLTLVVTSSKHQLKQIKKALKEVLNFANVEYNTEDATINHSSIHFNNFRQLERWKQNPEETLEDFKHELQPFLEWDWD